MERAFDERDARSSLEWKERCVARRKGAGAKGDEEEPRPPRSRKESRAAKEFALDVT